MDAKRLGEWIAEAGACEHISWYANGIDYEFYRLPDGWIAIFERDEGEYWPKIQAADMAHAKSWCAMRERINVPVAEI